MIKTVHPIAGALAPLRLVVGTAQDSIPFPPRRDWRRWQAVKRLTNSNKRQTADLIQSRRSEYDRPTASPQ
jgi:hypothetical protein